MTITLVFALDTLPMTVKELPQATDQDNPIPLGSHQVVNADTEQCLDSMLNNFQDVCQLMEVQDLEPVSPVQLKSRLKVAQNSFQYLDFDGLLKPLFIT